MLRGEDYSNKLKKKIKKLIVHKKMIKSEVDLQIENLTRNEEINIVLRCVDFMEDCIYVEIGDALKSPDIKT